MIQRDAGNAPRDRFVRSDLRPCGNSPSARHLTRIRLLCVVFYSIAQMMALDKWKIKILNIFCSCGKCESVIYWRKQIGEEG